MKARLRSVCKDCTASSLQTYYYNIKALAKMAGHDEPPNNGRWINSALLKKIRKTLPLMKFKNMTIAGNKALAAYGKKKNEEWSKAMQESTTKYNRNETRKSAPSENRQTGRKKATGRWQSSQTNCTRTWSTCTRKLRQRLPTLSCGR